MFHKEQNVSLKWTGKLVLLKLQTISSKTILISWPNSTSPWPKSSSPWHTMTLWEGFWYFKIEKFIQGAKLYSILKERYSSTMKDNKS